jgi:hypothetical protein
MNATKIRVGILLDSYTAPAWIYSCLQRVMSLSGADIALVILRQAASPRETTAARVWGRRRTLLYHLFDRLDTALFGRHPDALAPTSLTELLAGVPTVKVTPKCVGQTDSFSDDDVHAIKRENLDIIIKFGSGRLVGDVLESARFGVWAYRHGDNAPGASAPPGFWEVVERQPETSCVLQILRQSSHADGIVYRLSLFTYPFSPVRNRNYLLWASSALLARQIRILQYLGEEKFFARVQGLSEPIQVYDRRKYAVPANLRTLVVIIRLLARLFQELYRRMFFADCWYLLYELNHTSRLAPVGLNQLVPPDGSFWADPHLIYRDGRYFVFVEEYTHKTGKGRISVIELDEGGRSTRPLPVLEADYHMSYPFVFEWDSRYYMVPESSENGTIDLYECVEFPAGWRHRLTLMTNVKAVDATLIYRQGKWWLFAGMADNWAAFPQVELFLFFSDFLFSTDWQPHPLNPIVSDVKRARPAGRIFEKEGKMYRPSQDCSRSYGYGFDLNEIKVLSTTDYAEERRCSVRPNWDRNVLGCHTFATTGRLAMIDAFKRRRRIF